MTLKPPPPQSGESGLISFREAVKLYESSLTNRWSREFHRKELARWHKLYTTLASKRDFGSVSATHFTNVATLCSYLLAEYGPEPPPKKRAKKMFAPTPLTYPDFPDEIRHRLHFLEGPQQRRQRAIDMLDAAVFVSRQTSGTGRVLVSVGVAANQVRLFVHLIETLGGGLRSDLKKAGFDIAWVHRPEGIPQGAQWTQTPIDPSLPIARIWDDLHHASHYDWQAQALAANPHPDNTHVLPTDFPHDSANIPYDPETSWQQILKLTEANNLQEAAELVDSIPGRDRENLFDEVIYLRFLTGKKIRADDIRLIVRKYAESSLISGRLLDEFDDFLSYVDRSLEENLPVLENLSLLGPNFGQDMIPPRPPASDWPAYRAHIASFGTSSTNPKGRIFSINIDVGKDNCVRFFANYMIEADNSFRRDRSIPEIGRGWVSEVALLDLVRTIWPSAIHQWRPSFLGMQSIDIYVREINLAIEYQGQQHYEPVDLFGGEEGFLLAKARDEKKRALLNANKVLLLEWPYDVQITKAELVNHIAEMGIAVPVAITSPS